MKHRCDGSCSNQAAFLVLLRDLSEGTAYTEQKVCGRHVAWSVQTMEKTAATLRQIRSGRGRTFKEEVVVASLKSPKRVGGENGGS